MSAPVAGKGRQDLRRNTILLGDALATLRSMPNDSVDMVLTSPPYYRLRNYQAVGQLGLEDTVDEFVHRLTEVCDEVHRVLKSTGTFWLNLGDSFSRHPRYGAAPKSLLLAPERVALALVQRGWVLRNRVTWSKPNAMPSSVTDRLSCTYEVIYFFAKARSYFFDLDAIRVPHKSTPRGLTTPPAMSDAVVRTGKYDSADRSWAGPLAGNNAGLAKARAEGRAGHRLGKNPGDVWHVPTGGFKGAHFATFPERLITRPILAGCPARTCATCGVPWHQSAGTPTGPTCTCTSRTFKPGVVLDPYVGSGTTAVAATRLSRDWVGIELNATYRALALDRIAATVVRDRTRAKGGDAQPKGHHHEPQDRAA